MSAITTYLYTIETTLEQMAVATGSTLPDKFPLANIADHTHYISNLVNAVKDALTDMSLPVNICGENDYDPETGIPTVENPEENVFYLVPANDSGNDMFEEWIWTGMNWEHFGAGGSIEIPQSDWNEDDPTSPSYIKNKPGAAEGVSF